jgi:hypothetical protein
MFKLSPASLQTFIDTPNCVLEDSVQYSTVSIVQYSTVSIPNLFCGEHFLRVICTAIIRRTEIFYHPVHPARIGLENVRGI